MIDMKYWTWFVWTNMKIFYREMGLETKTERDVMGSMVKRL